MQNREAALLVTETLLSTAKVISSLFEKLDAFEQAGKVSEEESDRYHFHIMASLEDLFESVLNPIIEMHPDLRPACSCCASSEEDEQ